VYRDVGKSIDINENIIKNVESRIQNHFNANAGGLHEKLDSRTMPKKKMILKVLDEKVSRETKCCRSMSQLSHLSEYLKNGVEKTRPMHI